MVLSVLKHFYSVLSLELIKVGQCIKSQTTSIMHSFTCSIVKNLGYVIAATPHLAVYPALFPIASDFAIRPNSAHLVKI